MHECVHKLWCAVDWRTEKVYWTSGTSGRIYSAYTDGTNLVTLAVGDLTYALALDPCRGLMFWTDSGYRPGGGAACVHAQRAHMWSRRVHATH